MKKSRLIMIAALLTMLFLISACANSNVSSAVEAAEKYKLAELESPQIHEITEQTLSEKYEVMEPLSTQSFYERSVSTRVFIRGSQLAQLKESEVRLSNLEFTERNVADTQIELNYTGTVSVADETLDLEGTIYMLKEDDDWRVNNDIYNTEIVYDIIDAAMINKNKTP
ncbi:hypothetical protein SAMN05518848_102882 [Paenibacillus sp. PDC88]|nr:hypothetical protein SAMN05518848_102882 [Paenibacillus sp. PDC88]